MGVRLTRYRYIARGVVPSMHLAVWVIHEGLD